MDAYEATKIVFQRIQNLDPQNASKIMGFLLIQDHGEKEMIRLAFGSESLLQSVILQAKKELNLASSPPTPSSPLPFSNPLSLSRQNSAPSRTVNGVNLPSPLSVANHSSTVASSWTNSSGFSDDLISSPSTMNSAAAPFYGGAEVDLIDELHLQEQLSFLNDGSPPLGPRSSDLYYQDLSSSPTGTDPSFFPSYPWGGAAAAHRRSCSVSDICLGSDDLSGGFGWKPCLFYARGFCKNGTSCRFLHGEGDCGAPAVGSPNKYELMEQCQELIRSKLTQQQQQQLMASSNFPYSQLPASKCLNFLQLPPDSPRALMIGRGRLERGEFAMNGVNPGSRQIYLTFPADSTFKEEDVSSYFSKFGPVQDVRIPYQQKRMFGFVTFDYPETVKLILAKGNPHFVCDARVLVKPYKEKGKIPDKHRLCLKQQHMERGEFAGRGSPTGLDSRDPYDLGARMFYNSQDMLWGRKLEAQADLQQAIEIQNRRLMGLQLLDIKRNSHHRTLSGGAVISSPTTFSPTFFNQNPPSNLSSPEAKEDHAADAKDKDERSDGNDTPHKESYFQESSLEHNLPDSPFASPKATAFSTDTQEVEKGSASLVSAPTTNNNLITGPSMAPFKSCYFQVPRFASGHETVGM